MTWSDIGKNSLQAARRTLNNEPRSSTSRSYYAAHVVLAEALAQAGCPFPQGQKTPPHVAQAKLIGQHLAHRGAKFVKEIRAVIRRLQARRIDADYRRTVTVNRSTAMESVRDAGALFQLLNVR